MVPQGPPNPLGGAQHVPPSLLRSSSGLLGGQGPGMPSQNAFPSLVSPRNQFSNLNMLGNNNVSSLLHQSFGNGGPGTSQRGLVDGGPEPGPHSGIQNGMGFTAPSSSYLSPPVTASQNSSGQQQFPNTSGMLTADQQQQAQHQLNTQNFQHNNNNVNQQQFHAPGNSQQQQQQFQGMRPGLGPVKLEQQSGASEQASQQQLQALRSMGSVKMEAQQMGMGPVKMEAQQLQSMRGLGPVKLEPQHSDPSLFLQQQQQQLLRQSSQAAAAQILHQQRLIQIQQQQQQQQLLKAMPQQRSPIQQQQQQQFQQQNLTTIRSPVKPVYEPGMCARRLTHYMYQQQHRPEDNNIEFWRKFVAEYFAPNAKKKWCVSMYGSGRQTTGVFPQDVWHCEICNRKPGRGFEATVEVLARLFKIKYESGTIEELLYVDMPREYQNSSGQIVLDYAKAIQESVFEQLRVVRDGQLRIVFSPDLKICSWEFCARRHDELIPRRLLIPQVGQLGNAAQKYQAATQNTSSNVNVSELQNNCNMFVASARQLAKALEVPLVNDLGYTKRYVRCLQISEVVNSMKDLIDYSRETGSGPMESLLKFPRRSNPSSAFQGQSQSQQLEAQLQQQQQQQQQQTMGQNSNSNPNHPTPMQLPSTSANNTINPGPTNPTETIANLLHQNSMNSRSAQNPIPGPNPSYGGTSTMQMTSPSGSSNTMPQANPPQSPFQSPTPSTSNNNNNNSNHNPQPTSHNSVPGPHHASTVNSPNITTGQQNNTLSNDADTNDPQSSVQKIIQDMMMSSQANGGMVGLGSMGGDMKNVNGVLSSGGNILMGTGVGNGGMGISGFGGMQNGLGQSGMVNGFRAALGNNSLSVNRGMMNSQQQDMNSQLLAGLGAVNGYTDLAELTDSKGNSSRRHEKIPTIIKFGGVAGKLVPVEIVCIGKVGKRLVVDSGLDTRVVHIARAVSTALGKVAGGQAMVRDSVAKAGEAHNQWACRDYEFNCMIYL
ncbi:SEUSS family protein [Striga asiatica]|uniref:SEUSS family protein n=1 Tax=Striga asiatica TaxID=4170 RepID=A0A5A7PMN2_STRAF|nr:SEUSS family protein [Striga asiatica]